jgi:hypothetical protein
MINQVANCGNSSANTGAYGCDLLLKNFVGVIFANSAVEFEGNDAAALLTLLQTAKLNDNSFQRIYPVQYIDGTTAQNEDTVTTTTPYGVKLFVRNGKYDVTFTYHTGGMGVSNALYGSRNRFFFLVDAEGKVVGTQGSTATKIKAIPTSYYEGKPAGLNLGAEPQSFSFELQWDPFYTNTNIAVVDFANAGGLGALQALTGLAYITLAQAAARAAGVLHIKTYAGFGAVDIYSNYKSVLAAPALWVAKNKATGNLITVSSVAPDDNSMSYAVTLDTTDPDYTATNGGILVSLVGPTELDTAGVSGFESKPLAV